MTALLDHAFDEEPPMLKTLAATAGMPPAKAHRYMVSLLRAELVERDPVSGRYRLGPLARTIGFRAVQSIDVVRLASSRLPVIGAELDCSVALAIWTGSGPTIVSVEDRRRSITIGTRVGEVMPMVNSATGLVFSAWLPIQITEPLIKESLARLRRTQAKSPDLNLVTTMAELRDLLSEVRDAGVGFTRGALNPILMPALNAFSAPIFDHRGTLTAALSILGPANEIDGGPKGEKAQALRRAAHAISEQLGYSESLGAGAD